SDRLEQVEDGEACAREVEPGAGVGVGGVAGEERGLAEDAAFAERFDGREMREGEVTDEQRPVGAAVGEVPEKIAEAAEVDHVLREPPSAVDPQGYAEGRPEAEPGPLAE